MTGHYYIKQVKNESILVVLYYNTSDRNLNPTQRTMSLFSERTKG